MICGTKFPVRSVVNDILRQGMTPEEFVAEFDHVTLTRLRLRPTSPASLSPSLGNAIRET